MAQKLNETFHSDTAMKRLYYLYLIIGASTLFLSWMIPVIVVSFFLLSLDSATLVAASLVSPLSVAVLFVVLWIPKYYSSIRYTLTSREIVVERGVFWKMKSIVPYNRITNIDVVQGPLARRYRLGTVKIQTAGFSAAGGGGAPRVAEAVILNVKNFEEIKDTIMGFVRGIKPKAVEAETEEAHQDNIDQQILKELQQIRETLEKKL